MSVSRLPVNSTTSRIAIVEDEMIIAEDIAEILESFGYTVTGIAISAREALQLIEDTDPDLILLDIQLKGGRDGIDLGAEIRDHFRKPFVFLTSHADTGTLERAKEVNPYGYILKPFEDQAIHATIEMALANFSKEASGSASSAGMAEMVLHDSLFVRSNGMLVKIRFTEILYLEADGNYTVIHVRDKKYTLRAILKDLEQKLAGSQFARLHKSYLVNLNSIDAIDSQFVVVGDKQIPISRSQHSWLVRQIKTL